MLLTRKKKLVFACLLAPPNGHALAMSLVFSLYFLKNNLFVFETADFGVREYVPSLQSKDCRFEEARWMRQGQPGPLLTF